MTLDVRVRDLRPGDRMRYGRFGHIEATVTLTQMARPEWPGDKRRRVYIALTSDRLPEFGVIWNAATTIRIEREEPQNNG